MQGTQQRWHAAATPNGPPISHCVARLLQVVTLKCPHSSNNKMAVICPRQSGQSAAAGGCTHAGAAPHILDSHEPAGGALAHQLDGALRSLTQVGHLQSAAAAPDASAARRQRVSGGGGRARGSTPKAPPQRPRLAHPVVGPILEA